MYQGQELRIHDLRRTMASLMVNKLGVLPHVVYRILNHTDTNPLDKSYLQYDVMPEREAAMTAWGGYVAKLVGATEPALEDAREP